MIKSIFLRSCPNCGGDISSERLYMGLPCEKCLEDDVSDVCSHLKKEGFLKDICKISDTLEEWERFFEKKIKSLPWSLQKAWAKRVFLGRSFALLAPTGIGKTSFGLITSYFLAKKGKNLISLFQQNYFKTKLKKNFYL